MDRRTPRIEGFALGTFCGLTGGSELLVYKLLGLVTGESLKPCATGTGLGSGRGKAECSAIGMIHGTSDTGAGMCTGLTCRGTPSGTRVAARVRAVYATGGVTGAEAGT